MFLPTLGAGLVSFGILIALFYKQLRENIEPHEVLDIQIQDRYLLIIGLTHLALCIIGLAICSYVNIEMWIISLSAFVSLFICVSVYLLVTKKKFKPLESTIKRAPLELIPFVLSMFVIVLALKHQGVTNKMFDVLNVGKDGIVYTLTSALFVRVTV